VRGFVVGVRPAVLAMVAVSVSAPAPAHAGRSYYGWLYGTDVVPERGAELMTWVSEQNDQQPDHMVETRWWVGPLIGITDQLELALPVEVSWDRADHIPPHSAFDRWGAELRYRLVTQDPVDAPRLVPLVRVALYRSILDREAWIPEADVVLSYEQGRVQALADLGLYAELVTCSDRQNCDSTHFEVHPGVGISVRAAGDLRFGAEVHAELPLDHGGDGWAVAGPNLAWSHGRTWLSGSYGIGVYGIRDAPRVQWGIAF
jgi:hypothetical protein